MNPHDRASRRRLRSALVPLGVGVLMVASSACGSDSDASSDTGADTADSVAVADPPADTAPADTATPDTAPADTATPDTVAAGTIPSGTAVCGDLSAADVGAAVAAEFDSADDISVDADLSCLFSSSTGTDGVTVMTESADTYLGGSLAGLPIEDALAQLETAQSMFLDEGYTVEQTTIGGVPAIVIGGTNSVSVIPTGYASTVVDGVVIEVTVDGANLASGATGLGPLAAAVLELAVTTQT